MKYFYFMKIDIVNMKHDKYFVYTRNTINKNECYKAKTQSNSYNKQLSNNFWSNFYKQ